MKKGIILLVALLNFGILNYTGERYRDPFLPYLPLVQDKQTKQFISDDFRISGIVWGTPKPLAIINGKVVGIGDKILGAEVRKIDKNGVLLEYEGNLYLLSVPK